MPHLLSSFFAAAKRLGVPAGSTIELLAPCNLRCPHCYVTHSARNKLTLPVLEDLFDQMAALGSLYVTLTGGEIGLRRDLFEIIAAARERRFAVYLLTSGTLFGPEQWDRIAALGVNMVRVSLYGMEPCVHDAATQTPGSFEKTVATLEGLQARGVNVEISTPVMGVNAHDAANVLQWAQERGITIGFDPNITAMDSGDKRTKSTLASHDALSAFFTDPRFKDYFTQAMHDTACSPPASTGRPCGTGETSSFIRCSGEMFPCSVWPRPGGNVLEESYADIWFNSEEFRRARSLRNDTVPACATCGDRALCAPCAAMNMQDTGSMLTPSATVCDTTATLATALRGYSHQPHRGAPRVQPRRSASRLPILG